METCALVSFFCKVSNPFLLKFAKFNNISHQISANQMISSVICAIIFSKCFKTEIKLLLTKNMNENSNKSLVMTKNICEELVPQHFRVLRISCMYCIATSDKNVCQKHKCKYLKQFISIIFCVYIFLQARSLTQHCKTLMIVFHRSTQICFTRFHHVSVVVLC